MTSLFIDDLMSAAFSGTTGQSALRGGAVGGNAGEGALIGAGIGILGNAVEKNAAKQGQ